MTLVIPRAPRIIPSPAQGIFPRSSRGGGGGGGAAGVSARFWRLNHFATAGRAAAFECHFRDGSGTKIPATIAVSSVRYSNTGNLAYDGNTGTYWQAATGDAVNAWFRADFGAGNETRVESIYVDAYDASGPASGFTHLEYSADGTTWTDLGTITHGFSWAAHVTGVIDVSALTA